ncbi:tripartite motif-containing protein 16-like protein isoform X2 [Onychostoma macrolepis]|uniref:tripartite motif-containing protein 16-like protein isoform X2 n=1 Tax=Onychostoma macrolepis TaxID=369639 RepID=UPI00272AB324|nr:tripartite motif-containing protein 16-like protein isoform X2 [Onychostoma macrolepis]
MPSGMAEASISVGEDQFSCSICLDLLKDPVTIPCGHSYCMSCITDCWNQDDQRRVYSCPQCRQTFTPRPALNKNVMLAEMVEKLKKTKAQTARAALSYAGPGDVECDVCMGKKYKAVRSCLMCLNSYCQCHLEQHDSLFKDKKHSLINASGRLKEMICSQHDRLLEVYCRTDQQCICLLCTMNEHKNHHTISTKAERTEKQKQLWDMERKFQKRIQEREKEIQELKEALKTHKRSAQAAVKDSERIFNELIHSIERSCSEVIQMIRDREKAEVRRAEGLLKQLEQEIDDLRRRDTELQQLLHTDNHIHFLESFQSLSVPPVARDNITVISLLSYDDVDESVSMLREKLEDLCKEATENIYVIPHLEIVTTSELRTRDEFLQYSHQFTLDPNTAHKYLRLSEGNRVATFIGADQQYPVHPDRFHGFSQVLCRESMCGRCYWEVEWSGMAGVGISVSYKSISRKGGGFECVFGFNNQSWRLSCSDSRYSFRHNQKAIKLPIFCSSSRIGVYVDHRAGILSFYSVCDTMTLMHRIQTTFTQPLYPGFGINFGSTLKLSSAEIL